MTTAVKNSVMEHATNSNMMIARYVKPFTDIVVTINYILLKRKHSEKTEVRPGSSKADRKKKITI